MFAGEKTRSNLGISIIKQCHFVFNMHSDLKQCKVHYISYHPIYNLSGSQMLWVQDLALIERIRCDTNNCIISYYVDERKRLLNLSLFSTVFYCYVAELLFLPPTIESCINSIQNAILLAAISQKQDTCFCICYIMHFIPH